MEACGWDDEFWEEIGLGDLMEAHHAKIGMCSFLIEITYFVISMGLGIELSCSIRFSCQNVKPVHLQGGHWWTKILVYNLLWCLIVLAFYFSALQFHEQRRSLFLQLKSFKILHAENLIYMFGNSKYLQIYLSYYIFIYIGSMRFDFFKETGWRWGFKSFKILHTENVIYIY